MLLDPRGRLVATPEGVTGAAGPVALVAQDGSVSGVDPVSGEVRWTRRGWARGERTGRPWLYVGSRGRWEIVEAATGVSLALRSSVPYFDTEGRYGGCRYDPVADSSGGCVAGKRWGQLVVGGDAGGLVARSSDRTEAWRLPGASQPSVLSADRLLVWLSGASGQSVVVDRRGRVVGWLGDGEPLVWNGYVWLHREGAVGVWRIKDL